jgi:hypothetical protein
MTAVLDVQRHGWLHRETPLGVPAFTPLRVRPSSENCYFQIDGFIVRMVYLGGLSGDDPSAAAWTLRATTHAGFSGIEFWKGWQTKPFQNMITYNVSPAIVRGSDLESHRDALASIERITGFSRRELTTWLQTSHTTLNGIANSDRIPRSMLASRIVDFSRLAARLQAIFGDDQDTIRRALTTDPEEGESALSLVLQGDYQRAATAAQYAIRPRRKLKPIRGDSYMDSPMVAVENI